MHAHKLCSVVVTCGYQGVGDAAQVERNHAARAPELHGAAVAKRSPRLQGAVSVDAYQLDAAVGARGDEGVRGAAQAERGDVAGVIQLQGAAVGQGAYGLHGAVVVHAHQVHGVVVFRADKCMPMGAHLECGHGVGAAAQPHRAGGRDGAVAVHADQLDAVASRSDD